MGVGSHAVTVALLASDLGLVGVVELVERAGEGAGGVSVLGDLCSL